MNFAQKVRENWKSGLTVSLVSIPLSISLAIASHATPLQGIITAVWAGLVASLFAGSKFNIVGPTGALSGILATFALVYGAGSLPSLAIVAGVLILLAYLFKLERFLTFIPASALHGFTLGVAFIIGFGQFNFAFGLPSLPQHEKFIANLFESFHAVGLVSWPALTVFVLFLCGLLVLTRRFPKFPGVIMLAPVGIVLGYLSVKGILPFQLQTLESKFGSIPQTLWQAPHFIVNSAILVPAATIALVAIMETMISAKIADGMTKTKHDKRKEMMALGLANIGSGLFGGIPATAALARTSLNIKAGANNKMSATASSVAIAAVSLALLPYFKYIPMAVIAAILVFTAIGMIEAHHYVRMFKIDKLNFFLSIFVAVITVYQDPIIGILMGTAIALLVFLEKLSHGQFELVVNTKDRQIAQTFVGEELDSNEISPESHTLVYSIKGQLVYLNAQAHISRFENSLNGYENVILRCRSLYFLDMDGVDAFDEIVGLIEKQGRNVYVTGVNPMIENMLAHSKTYPKLEAKGRIYKKTKFALKSLGYNIANYVEPAPVLVEE